MSLAHKTVCIILVFLFLILAGMAQSELDSTNAQIRIVRVDKLNSEFRETNVCISPTGDYIFWQSPRGGQPWSVKRYELDLHGKSRYDGDIWYAVREENGGWSAPRGLKPPVNSSNNEDEPMLSPNGRYVYYQSWDKWQNSGGPYYRAEFKGANWTSSKGLGGGIHAFFSKMMNQYRRAATDGATLSADGKTFIVAAGPDYTDRMDIYMSRKNSKGIWSDLKPLPFNTYEDERSVFLAADGKTLYFASAGYEGMGGLDIFKVQMQKDGTWGAVMNIGAPFNTERDDYNFVLTASGNEAYFVRDGDIYYADLATASDTIKPVQSRIIRGIVRHPISNDPLDAALLLKQKGGKTISRDKTHPQTGEYVFVVPDENQEYLLLVRAKGFPIDTFDVEVRKTGDELTRSAGDPVEITMDIKPELPKNVVDDPNSLIADNDTAFHVYFDTDIDSLDEVAINQMQEIIRLMKRYKTAQVKLLGHTDSDGSDEYNMDLSEGRVSSVYEYLISKGYPAERILMSYYGEAIPVAENTTAKGKQLNRRVEVRFTRKN